MITFRGSSIDLVCHCRVISATIEPLTIQSPWVTLALLWVDLLCGGWRFENYSLPFLVLSIPTTQAYLGFDIWVQIYDDWQNCDSTDVILALIVHKFYSDSDVSGVVIETASSPTTMIQHPHPLSLSSKMLGLKQQQYEGEVTNGSCGLIPQTKAAILIQIAIIIIITMIIVLLLMMMMMLIWDKVR